MTNPCQPHTLYLVATPIGNLADFSQRAIDVLSQVDIIYAEDTRHSRPLCQHFNIQTPLQSYHQHNEHSRLEEILQHLEQGKSIALISDAGTPLISDPGFPLVTQAHERGIAVVPIPGACAAIAALTASGIACDRFRFVGFIATKGKKREQQLTEVTASTQASVLYESVHRIRKLIDDLATRLAPARKVCIARELSKRHEQVLTLPMSELHTYLQDGQLVEKGEFVVIVAGDTGSDMPDDSSQVSHKALLQALCQHLPLSTAVSIARDLTGEKHKILYQLALQLKQDHPDNTTQ